MFVYRQQELAFCTLVITTLTIISPYYHSEIYLRLTITSPLSAPRIRSARIRYQRSRGEAAYIRIVFPTSFQNRYYTIVRPTYPTFTSQIIIPLSISYTYGFTDLSPLAPMDHRRCSNSSAYNKVTSALPDSESLISNNASLRSEQVPIPYNYCI